MTWWVLRPCHSMSHWVNSKSRRVRCRIRAMALIVGVDAARIIAVILHLATLRTR
jgi:hypothetical protein